jgi:quinol monooxygenase YgiN
VGNVVVTIEYLIDPARADDFRALMQESRRSRLRQGALEWELLRDVNRPGRFVEQIVDESWTEHLRRFDRVTCQRRGAARAQAGVPYRRRAACGHALCCGKPVRT